MHEQYNKTLSNPQISVFDHSAEVSTGII